MRATRWAAGAAVGFALGSCGAEGPLLAGAPAAEAHLPGSGGRTGPVAEPISLLERRIPAAASAAADVPVGRPAEHEVATTVVTLSFDDGLASQREVPRILERSGLRASFFVCTGRLGAAGYLDWADLHAIAAAGHEIGGHTRDHDVLTALDPAAARTEVCADREALVEEGFAPVSFAYPKSSSDDRVAPIVGECGYRLARSNKGLGRPDGSGCVHCPAAESLEPEDPLQLRSPPSMPSGIRLEGMQAWVLAAEEEGGGWVNITFHEVLEACGGDAYCIEPDLLAAFAAWLAGRAERGTVVRTQAEAFGLGR